MSFTVAPMVDDSGIPYLQKKKFKLFVYLFVLLFIGFIHIFFLAKE